MLRRREWARIHRGVYVNHTGPPTWRQRAWAAVLFYWPAVLSHDSAVSFPPSGPLSGEAAGSTPLKVAIEHPRRAATRLPGVRVHRLHDLEHRALWNLGPPRMRVEEAVLDMCAAADTEFDALAVLTDACQSRRSTATRLEAALSRRKRLRHGRWLREVLADVESGVMSVLEHAYLTRVERAHGLPGGRRQKPAAGEDGAVYRDVEYEGYGFVVELDGRLWHTRLRQRSKDIDRDLDTAIMPRLALGRGTAVSPVLVGFAD